MRTFQRVKSFADVPFTHSGIPLQDFLDASDGLVQLFDLLGRGVFSFIQSDIRGNIAGLRKRLNHPTLEAILATNDNDAIGCLVRLIRGFHYICTALSTLQSHPDLELYVCFKRAYDQVLREHHSALVHSLVAVAIRAAPSRQEFYRRIGEGVDTTQLDIELEKWLAGMERIVNHISPQLPYH